jgi:hypothetical protein
MTSGPPSDWLEKHIWPQIQAMMIHDAYFKLMNRARELTGEFNGAIAWLIVGGYLTFQMLTIRRLSDQRKDVISLRRALIEAGAKGLAPPDKLDQLLSRLDSCDYVCELVNDYLAHTANPLRRPNVSEWDLQVRHLIEAQKAICQVAITLDRDLLRRRNYVKIIPVQLDVMQDFKSWVPDAAMKTLWEFWHAHDEAVDAWIT